MNIKPKTKRNLIRLFSAIMIIFTILNILTTVSGIGNHVYADDEESSGSGFGLGTVLGNGALGGLSLMMMGLPLLILNVLKLIIIVIGLLLQALMSGAYSTLEGNLDWAGLKDIIFAGANNCSQFLDINFFAVEGSETYHIFRQAVAKWYYILRLISAAILLVILIYVGIRMALSTIASEQAKYKQMLVDWITSIALLFLLHYIIIFAITVNSSLVNALKVSNEDASASMISEIVPMMFHPGFEGVFAAIVYVIYVGMVFSFFVLYMKRLITVGFLIMIAPLITITYSIDKIGDGKAQALNAWLKELVYNILIQPFHCVLFMAFFDAIASMIKVNKFSIGAYIFAIVVMKFMKTAEEILRKIFHFEASSMSSLKESGQNIANATGKFVGMGMAAGGAVSALNSAGAFDKLKAIRADKRAFNADKKLKKHFDKTEKANYSSFEEYKNSDKGQELLQSYTKHPLGTRFKNTKVGQKISKVAENHQKKKDGKLTDKAQEALTANMTEGQADDFKENYNNAIGKMKKGEKLTKEEQDAFDKVNAKKTEIKENSPKTRIKGYAKNWGEKYGDIAKAGIKDSTKVAAAIGLGAFAYGSTGQLNDAITAGQLGFGFSKGILENSNKTLTNGAADTMQKYLDVTGEKAEDGAKLINNINAEGNMGGFEPKVLNEAMEKLIDKITQALGGGDNAKKAAQNMLYNLRLDATEEKTKLDVNQLVNDLNLDDGDDKDEILQETNKFAETYLKSIMYSYLTQAKSLGTDANGFGEKVTNKVIKVTNKTENNTYNTENNTYNTQNNYNNT